MACPLATERIWVEKSRYHDAEREYYERLAKLLKGTISIPITENSSSTVNLDKNKKKSRKNTERSQSPENMKEASEVLPEKPTPSNGVSKGKKNKKIKSAEPDSSTNSLMNKTQESPINTDIVEETKSKKKKKKKANKDVSEKLQDVSQKENVPPTTPTEPKTDMQDSNKKIKNSKSKGPSSNQCTLVSEIAKARQHIKNSLEKMDGIATLAATPVSPDILDRLAAVEKENADLRILIEQLKGICIQSENRVNSLERKLSAININTNKADENISTKNATEDKIDDDDGVDLFASDSDEDDAKAAKIREERLAAYAAKKSKKPALIAKSSLVLDVKPWDDETDMKAMETEVRKITTDGLLWGASKNVPVAFGIQKLSISCVVEDEKVSIDWLTEEIEKLEDFVQSVDIAAFNKI